MKTINEFIQINEKDNNKNVTNCVNSFLQIIDNGINDMNPGNAIREVLYNIIVILDREDSESFIDGIEKFLKLKK